MAFGAQDSGSDQGLAEIEKDQAELLHCIEEAKRLAEDNQELLDRSAHAADETPT